MTRLAIITSHPIQYYAPWFRHIAGDREFQLRVFYLWDFGVTRQVDVGFQQAIQWDVSLLSGYESEFVPNTSSNPGTSTFWGLRNPLLTSRVEAFDPDVVLMIGYNYAALFRFMLNWRRHRAPLVLRGDSHRLASRRGATEWLRRRTLTKIFEQFSACLYVGEANRRYFRHHGVPDDKLCFAPHSVDNRWFIEQHQTARLAASRWKTELGIARSSEVVLFAGKFETKKRPLDLLEAFSKARLENVALLFVGAGELESEMKARAKNRSDVFFAPFQNQSQMPKAYATANVVVLASYGPYETWGLAINEAMCMGRPVIVSTHVGCGEDLVRHGQSGLVFPAGDVDALSRCLEEAFVDRERLREWGKEGFRIIQDYSYARATAGLKEALASLKIPLRFDQVEQRHLNEINDQSREL